MKTFEFDQRFDDGDAILDPLDVSQARRQRLELNRVNVDFPLWMMEQLDRGASRMGVTRQSTIKMWLAERLDRQHHPTDTILLHAGEA